MRKSIHLGCRMSLPSGLKCENAHKHPRCNPVARCLFCNDKLQALKDFIATSETFPTFVLSCLYSILVNLLFT